MEVTYDLGSTGTQLCIGYAENVTNAPEIRKCVLEGKLDATVVKSSLVPDPILLAVAANKACLYQSRNSMRTRSIHTEILFNLSSSTNISQSLNTFGASDKDDKLIVCTLNKDLSEAKNLVKGDWCDMSNLRQNCDLKSLKKLHKLKDPELEHNNLVPSLVTKIAAKDTL